MLRFLESKDNEGGDVFSETLEHLHEIIKKIRLALQ